MDANALKEFCEALERAVSAIVPSGLEAREDARAFGAAIERLVRDEWPSICANNGWVALDPPGKRDIGDVRCESHATELRVDVKTHDRDEGAYADGGVCSVDNFLRLLAGPADCGLLVVLEVTHESDGARGRKLVSVDAIALHCAPTALLRVENLGTGQVRLDERVRTLKESAQWNRTVTEFLAPFVALAKAHYDAVIDAASQRKSNLDEFVARGYRGFKGVR